MRGGRALMSLSGSALAAHGVQSSALSTDVVIGSKGGESSTSVGHLRAQSDTSESHGSQLVTHGWNATEFEGWMQVRAVLVMHRLR